mmetsp:Transcript_11544/g.29242  ORF Transcript_11544/g.29242 Transcript_11544/m.29242 type:complete len:923 (-) Transcript_11544:352-3120(-)
MLLNPLSAKERELRQRMERAAETARRVLGEARAPAVPSDVPHAYRDKFLLAERAANGALTAMMAALESAGLTGDKLEQTRAWCAADDARAVTLRFESELKCTFLHTKDRKEALGPEQVSSVMGIKRTSKSVNTITEHFWDVAHTYRIRVLNGTDLASALTLQERTGHLELKTAGKERISPHPEHSVSPTLDVSLNGLFKLLKGRQGAFAIDRTAEKCHTPIRNKDCEELSKTFSLLRSWSMSAVRHLRRPLGIQQSIPEEMNRLDVHQLEVDNKRLFVPVLPLFANKEDAELIKDDDVFKLHEEHVKQLKARLSEIATSFPDPGENTKLLFTAQEASVVVLAEHLRAIAEMLELSLDFVEGMLRKQLVEAIGKEVTPDMIEEYMRYHYVKLFGPNVFRPFCYDIKRDGFAPEGSLTIRNTDSDSKEVATFVRERSADYSDDCAIRFKLSAAASVEMRGPQFVHGLLAHRFSSCTSMRLELSARARQFSCFVLMVGTLPSKDRFEPAHALIVQNKDCAVIPLLLDPLPSAKAFRDAIESLSPEQQEFARAMRAMQLQSTLFAVAVVEIKPQLEQLLKLPAGSLTKEIKLTQDLVRLFIEFQVPCDLMTYDGPEDASSEAKLSRVKEYVKNLMDMVAAEKEKEAAEAKVRMETAVRNRVIDDLDESEDSELTVSTTSRSRSSKSFRGRGGKGMQPMFRTMAAPASIAAPAPSRAMNANCVLEGFGGGSMQQQAQMMSMEVANDSSHIEADSPHEPSNIGDKRPLKRSRDGDDLTTVPALMDERFEEYDPFHSLCATKIKVDSTWRIESFAGLLAASPRLASVREDELVRRRSRAMDLLDALSRSGDLPLAQTQLHVVVAATHCFDQTVMTTIIEKNINPLARLEHSAALVATTVTGKGLADIVTDEHRDRLKDTAPKLFELRND